MKWRSVSALILCALLLGTSAPPARAQLAEPHPATMYMPLLSDGQAAAPVPLGFEDVGSVRLPFVALDAMEPAALRVAGGYLVAVFRVESGDLNGGWYLLISEDLELLDMAQYSTAEEPLAPAAVQPIPLGEIARFAGSCRAPGAAPLLFAWPATDRGRGAVLLVKRVVGDGTQCI